MKLLLRISLFFVLPALFASCVKTVESPPVVQTDPLVGSWYLYEAAEWDGYRWYSFDAGVDGVLSFYNSGVAEYDDGYLLMQGSWRAYDSYDGYYNEYGNYYSNRHPVFETQLSGHANSSLSLYFDYFIFTGNNRFTGTYYNGSTLERYTFVRY